jgi:hypothetical protein
MKKRVVMYSGGALSWAAAMRTIERHGRENLRLLFTDTSMEDEDLYRFLDDSEKQLGVEIVRIKDGRTPWDVYRDKRMMGNTRMDPCSAELKRKIGQRWLADTASGATLVFGIDWTEMHRLEGLTARYAAMGYGVEAPMCDAPWKTKSMVFEWMRECGIEPPRLYAMGFAHNNCGGFCCRAGQGNFATLLKQMPERYAFHEQKEQEMRDFLGKDVAILRDRKTIRLTEPITVIDEDTDEERIVWEIESTLPLTLQEFRKRIESSDLTPDLFEIGGCGCFVEDEYVYEKET